MSSLPRLSWVVDQLHLQPDHHVLEVGCGHGIAAGPVLDRLATGRYVGLDRSAPMIEASERRNRRAVESGRARFVRAAVPEADLGDVRFERIFAARVVALSAPAGLAFAARHLTPGGSLLLAFDSPRGTLGADLLAGVTTRLREARFERPRWIESRVDGHPVAAVSATTPTS